jgi:hypothetical protein
MLLTSVSHCARARAPDGAYPSVSPRYRMMAGELFTNTAPSGPLLAGVWRTAGGAQSGVSSALDRAVTPSAEPRNASNMPEGPYKPAFVSVYATPASSNISRSGSARPFPLKCGRPW